MGILNRKAIIMLMLPLGLSMAQAAERFPPAIFKVTEHLNNVTINFNTGLPTETIATKVQGEFDAITGFTRDVKGQEAQFYAYFTNPADLKRFIDTFEGGDYVHVNGTLQCKLVHVGTGPIVPPSRTFGIVADDCVIKTLKPVPTP